MSRWDETWHRLREWTSGQGPSERLAAQVLLAEGYRSLDPSHPLGGKDAGKDALVHKGGAPWIMAVYFPRGQQSFAAIRKKFLDDSEGVAANDADGMVFVTNQELSLSERKTLSDAVDTSVEIYHLERVTAILDQPSMYGVRAQFLDIADPSESTVDAVVRGQTRLEGLQTGGDSYCYAMLYHFDLQAAVAQQSEAAPRHPAHRRPRRRHDLHPAPHPRLRVSLRGVHRSRGRRPARALGAGAPRHLRPRHGHAAGTPALRRPGRADRGCPHSARPGQPRAQRGFGGQLAVPVLPGVARHPQKVPVCRDGGAT
jgi:hypothetical protein